MNDSGQYHSDSRQSLSPGRDLIGMATEIRLEDPGMSGVP